MQGMHWAFQKANPILAFQEINAFVQLIKSCGDGAGRILGCWNGYKETCSKRLFSSFRHLVQQRVRQSILVGAVESRQTEHYLTYFST